MCLFLIIIVKEMLMFMELLCFYWWRLEGEDLFYFINIFKVIKIISN